MIQIAWTSPRTWTVGETLTAANMNTHVRDNLNWLANDKPRCSAVRTTNLSVAHATLTLVTLNATDEFDVGSMHDPAGGTPSRVIVPSGGGGLYQINANLTWAANNAGSRDLLIYKNGAAVSGAGDTRVADLAGDTIVSSAVAVAMVATDYIELQVAQDTGSALNVTHARLQLIWQAF